MIKLRYKLGIVGGILLSVFLFGRSCASPKTKIPTVLPPGDTEQIRVDPAHHTITVVTPTGSHTTTLPDRTSVIDIRKGGNVVVTAPQMGLEVKPFIGLGYGQGVRVYFGGDLAYFKKADFGVGVALPSMTNHSGWDYNDFRVGLFASCGVYSNSRVTLGIDQQKAVHFLVSVRL